MREKYDPESAIPLAPKVSIVRIRDHAFTRVRVRLQFNDTCINSDTYDLAFRPVARYLDLQLATVIREIVG